MTPTFATQYQNRPELVGGSRWTHDTTAFPRTNMRALGLTTLEVVVALMLSPFLVVGFVLCAIPMLVMSPLFLTDEYEPEHPLGAGGYAGLAPA